MSPVPYRRYRVGISFQDVREELHHEQQQKREAGGYMFVTRRTVLGRMAQHKRHAYREYLAELGGAR